LLYHLFISETKINIQQTILKPFRNLVPLTKPNKPMNKTPFYLIIILCLSSCATGFNVKVNSYGNTDFSNIKTYIIMPGDDEIVAQSLQYKEYVAYIDRVLHDKNYRRTNDIVEADVLIFINYGISDPHTYETTKSLPVYGNTGVSSSSTAGTFKVNPYSGNVEYNQSTYYKQSRGVVGYRNVTKTSTEFYRYLHLTAVDWQTFLDTDEIIMLWQTEVTSIGSTDDLRRVFPVLVGASFEYYGKDTGQKVSINIYENDDRVKEVKGIY
jgi:hypothetical protein